MATVTEVDLSPARVEFTDANGRRWSRRPAARPTPVRAPVAKVEKGEVAANGRLAVEGLRHCG